MKNLVVVSGWFISSVLTLIVSVSTVQLVSTTRVVEYTPSQAHNSQQILAFNKSSHKVLGSSSTINSADARPLLISTFLEHYNSPLRPYDYWGIYLVNLADQHNMDFRLLPAMAMQESNLCKKIPQDSFNCLGLGVHSQGTWKFENFEANFAKAAEILKKNYIDIGLDTPAKIETKYTPSSNGSWQFAVNQFMDRIQTAKY